MGAIFMLGRSELRRRWRSVVVLGAARGLRRDGGAGARRRRAAHRQLPRALRGVQPFGIGGGHRRHRHRIADRPHAPDTGCCRDRRALPAHLDRARGPRPRRGRSGRHAVRGRRRPRPCGAWPRRRPDPPRRGHDRRGTGRATRRPGGRPVAIRVVLARRHRSRSRRQRGATGPPRPRRDASDRRDRSPPARPRWAGCRRGSGRTDRGVRGEVPRSDRFVRRLAPADQDRARGDRPAPGHAPPRRRSSAGHPCTRCRA